VNSRHHQAVKDVARGFRVSATAPDGVIEAIEDPAALFCLGVQWHPENFFRTGEFRSLFEGFVEAAQKKSGKPRKSRSTLSNALHSAVSACSAVSYVSCFRVFGVSVSSCFRVFVSSCLRVVVFSCLS